MSEQNPYQPPASPVERQAPRPGGFSAGGRVVDAGRGWQWVAEGFALFKKRPGMWILTLVVFIVISVVVSAVFSPANMLVMQVLLAGVMLGCRALDNGEDFDVGCLFAGFKQNTGDLVVLGLLAMVGWIIALIPSIVIMGGGTFMAMMFGGSPVASFGALGLSFLLAMLIAAALFVPVYMALWFAPALIVFNNLKAVDAMKASFSACLKNIVPFLVYGIVLLVLCFAAAIPFGLGFLVLGPVVVASVYTGYQDIFAVE